MCHTRLEYAGQPGDYGFDQRCPKCEVTRDCGNWEAMKKEMDANKVKRAPREILRSDNPKTCKFCVACAAKILVDDPNIECPITKTLVFDSSTGCEFQVPHVLPVQNCSNCKSGIDKLFNRGHGCKVGLGFPSENQWMFYTSCEKFDPKATVLKEAYEYYKAKSKMLEMM